jgi:hypothetical protein
MVAYSTNTAFRTARGLVTSAVIGASMLGLSAFPASAQQRPEQITVTTDCSKYQPGVLMADTKCEILKGQVLNDQRACLVTLLEFKKAAPAKFNELGPVTRENACELAGRVKPSASISGPRVGG